MTNAKTSYTIAAKNQAFGIEGERQYTGTLLGAKRAAAKLAKQCGFGWSPVVVCND